ncbi:MULTISPECIES: relaxase/mobilization nuclease domain-containing protein [Pseudoalteromonas]|uniref:MobA/VirD2-like nuclease domain-containing protein n=1 Tax=Pseudoalteromonas amylolytica TaxID=1859457 RepID=A0A1S1MTC1_9GAMM|nr:MULTISPECIES: hypothetical protein [Pseudoalteromonas]OHU89214.1 hypothetical protein BFC16_06140 [Pseudoalteromonas sp. JW3]OHU92114.1 hypothetical protein BET10_07245 [Pseudoalteromonas amylolytica]
MILHGNSRGGARDLALHLLKDENDHVTIHELRGFASEDLVSALKEIQAISRGTKAKQYLFSLSLNPPANECVPTDIFEETIERIEDKLKLTGQQRAIVFHEKNLRRHCHVVWSRIDGESMKAIPLPFTKRKLMEISRELYFENGWDMPDGFLCKKNRDPNNFTLGQWQQAKRTAQNPKDIKDRLKSCWSTSKTASALQSSLQSQGFTLAKGNRRAYVVVDQNCEVYSLPRWLGLKTKEIKTKLGGTKELVQVNKVKVQIAKQMEQRLTHLKNHRIQSTDSKLVSLNKKHQTLILRHQTERKELAITHEQRQVKEIAIRQERYRKGIAGIWDLLNGRHRRIKQQNEREAALATIRDQKERDKQVFEQLETVKQLHNKIDRLQSLKQKRIDYLEKDIDQYRDIQSGQRDKYQHEISRQAPER